MEQITEGELTGGRRGSNWKQGGGDCTASGTNKSSVTHTCADVTVSSTTLYTELSSNNHENVYCGGYMHHGTGAKVFTVALSYTQRQGN